MSYSLTKPQTLTAADRSTLRSVVTYHVNTYEGHMLCGLKTADMYAQKYNVHQTALYVDHHGHHETNCKGCREAQIALKGQKCDCTDGAGNYEPNRDCLVHGDGN